MGFWSSLPYIGKFFPSTYRKSTIFGLDGDFSPNQYNSAYPFEEAFIKTSDVYAINNMIAKNAKDITWKLLKKQGDKITEITSGDEFDLINKPNKEQTLSEFIEQAVLSLNLSGNIYLVPDLIPGFTTPEELLLLYPQLVDITAKWEGKKRKASMYKYSCDGTIYQITPENIVHYRYCNPSQFGIDTMKGLSPLTAGYLTNVALLGNQTASASIYKHQGAAGILSNESDYVLTEDQQKVQQSLFDKKMAGASLFGKVIQSTAKVKYTRLGLDPSQLKLIEGKLLKMRDLCSIYDVSSILLNDPANTTYNNIREAEKSFWKKAVIPANYAVMRTVENAVLSKLNERSGSIKYYLEQNLSDIDSLKEDATVLSNRSRTTSETIVRIMTSQMTPEQKIQTLVESLQITLERAKEIVGKSN